MREPDARKAAHFSALPEEWKIVPLLYATKYTTGFTPPSGNDKYYGGDYPWVNISDLDGRRVLFDTQRSLSTDAIERFPEKHPAPKGSLLFSFKLSLGNVAIAGRDLFTNEAIAAFIPNKELSIDYAYYCFPVFLPLYSQTNIYGAELLGASRFERTKIPLPPVETQRRIADYLDRETAEIDAAVADLDKYIELLKQRMQSASHETFRELSDKCPLIQTKFLANITTGSGDTQDSSDNGLFPFYVRSDVVQAADDYEFDCDAVLTSGDGAGVGKIFHLATGKFKAHQRVYVMYNFRKVTPAYFYWMFKCAFPASIKYGGAKSTVDSVRMPMIANLKLPVPSMELQEEISDRLASLEQEVASLILDSTRLRDLLLKRRSILITEVVTGRKQV